MKRLLAMILLLLVALSPLRTMRQYPPASPDAAQDWLVNLPSSPLVFETNVSRRALDLFNHGSKPIKKYRLGCVVEENGKLKIAHKMAVMKRNLAPNEGLLDMMYVYADHKSRCDKHHAKLSVIEVTFSDGSQWKAK